MIQIYRTRGPDKGVHYIFDNYTEAVERLSSDLAYLNVNGQDLTFINCFPHWTNDNVKEGDWITCDNGRVVQVLKIYILKPRQEKRKISGKPVNPTVCIKTIGKIASWKWSEKRQAKYFPKSGLRIDEAALTSSVFQQTLKTAPSRYEVCGITRKKIFVYYLAIYSSPMFAYIMTWRTFGKFAWKHNPPKRVILREVAKLLSDPFTETELLKYNIKMKTFREKLSKELSLAGITEERIVEELSSGLDSVKKGTQTHKQFIELLMNIKRYADGQEDITPDGKKLPEVAQPLSIQLPPPPDNIRQRIDIETRRVVLEQSGQSDKNINKLLSESKINNTDDENFNN